MWCNTSKHEGKSTALEKMRPVLNPSPSYHCHRSNSCLATRSKLILSQRKGNQCVPYNFTIQQRAESFYLPQQEQRGLGKGLSHPVSGTRLTRGSWKLLGSRLVTFGCFDSGWDTTGFSRGRFVCAILRCLPKDEMKQSLGCMCLPSGTQRALDEADSDLTTRGFEFNLVLLQSLTQVLPWGQQNKPL